MRLLNGKLAMTLLHLRPQLRSLVTDEASGSHQTDRIFK